VRGAHERVPERRQADLVGLDDRPAAAGEAVVGIGDGDAQTGRSRPRASSRWCHLSRFAARLTDSLPSTGVVRWLYISRNCKPENSSIRRAR
jgi:hypothetical protein